MQELEREVTSIEVSPRNGATQKIIVPPQINFKEISFHYPDCRSNALNNISFSIPAGKITAIVGSSGGGKTTCLGMLERFYEPQSGSITINGEEISNLNLSTYRNYVSYVDQNSVLATGTIRDNLDLGDVSYSDQEMMTALRQVGLTELARTSRRSLLDEPVGEQGLSLSGGQKQRLSIARALLHHPSLLVMDEPTSSLDGLSEQKIIDLLTTHKNELTLCYTAHRLSTILKADWIVVIDHGKVLAEGEHKQLMKSCDYYKALITSQVDKYKTISN
ncbi:ABC transporter ATP-binding protein [Bifidobacterium bombi]|uniref:ABC transporter ATP-binding protein n=1 Tax=Bifidobacterium bombi TaxID=471511 RepID=UPI00138E24AA|nr:ATP-binding cassette domain-containing protein [Bifidobacterium bombi]